MAYWRESFNGNRMSPKWRATRYSTGGELDGVWTREVRDHKLYWHPLSSGTESMYFGEWLSLPVNSPGDIIVDAVIRGKGYGGAPNGFIGVGFNQVAASRVLYGAQLNFPASVFAAFYGTNNLAIWPWPGFPSKIYMMTAESDLICSLRVVRQGGYMTIYINGYCVAQYAYAPTITTVEIYSTWQHLQIQEDHWLHNLTVWPREAVL
jgi:hypothetical protein